jgi:hypothetical protein
MQNVKRRAKAVAMAAITEEEARRDPVRAFEIAMSAARGFLSAWNTRNGDHDDR